MMSTMNNTKELEAIIRGGTVILPRGEKCVCHKGYCDNDVKQSQEHSELIHIRLKLVFFHIAN